MSVVDRNSLQPEEPTTRKRVRAEGTSEKNAGQNSTEGTQNTLEVESCEVENVERCVPEGAESGEPAMEGEDMPHDCNSADGEPPHKRRRITSHSQASEPDVKNEKSTDAGESHSAAATTMQSETPLSHTSPRIGANDGASLPSSDAKSSLPELPSQQGNSPFEVSPSIEAAPRPATPPAANSATDAAMQQPTPPSTPPGAHTAFALLPQGETASGSTQTPSSPISYTPLKIRSADKIVSANSKFLSPTSTHTLFTMTLPPTPPLSPEPSPLPESFEEVRDYATFKIAQGRTQALIDRYLRAVEALEAGLMGVRPLVNNSKN
ncbi:hypothetical protein C8R43DRAFT_298068 [Mycena crocata]|nr:hypothetical protein C8R43DRAFT_298068 [Mycena crocata]